MKLTKVLAAALVGLGFVAASPIPTSPQAPDKVHDNPEVHEGHVSWSPPDTYKFHPKRRAHWEQKCKEALARAGCDVGTIHQGRIPFTKANGEITSYVKVDGASTDMTNTRKMRVFHDGSFQDGWSAQDWRESLEPRFRNPRMRKDAAGNTFLLWHPPRTYRFQPRRKEEWERRCDEVLTRAGCKMGIIHQVQSSSMRKHHSKMSYVNVEGSPSLDMTSVKKLRVFDDGSTDDFTETGWPDEDRKNMAKGKVSQKRKRPAPESRTALLQWDPANAYKDHKLKRFDWEEKCDRALTSKGCRFGVIHKGQSSLIKPSGESAPYVLVEGSPSKDTGPVKKMRVFLDGSSEELARWTFKDQESIREGKRLKKSPGRQEVQDPQRDFSAFMLWDPHDAYPRRQERRAYWEQRCDPALAKEDCLVGIIHMPEIRVRRSKGEKTSYINVEGTLTSGTEPTKQMRVFQDGRTEPGWSGRDQLLMEQAKLKRAKKTQKYAVNPAVASTSSQVPTAETGIPGLHERPGELPHQQQIRSTQTHVQAAYPSGFQAPDGSGYHQYSAARAPTQVAFPEFFHGPGGSEYHLHPETQTLTQESTQDNPKRRRVGEDH